MTAWKHDALMRDLAAHLRAGGRRLVWCNIALGAPGSPRPDVFTMVPFSWVQPELTAYEIKVSKSDLRSDVTSGKWQAYLSGAESVIFAVPQGLATKADIPNRCGLMVRSERGWRTVRKGIRNPTELDRTLALKLISLRPNWSDSATWLERHGHSAPDYLRDQARKEALARAGRDLSKEIAEAVEANIEGREQTSEAAKRIVAGAEKERDKILAECADLLGALGIDPDTSPWQISTEIRKRAALLIAGESAVGALTRACDEAAKALERGRLLADLAVPLDGGPEPAA